MVRSIGEHPGRWATICSNIRYSAKFWGFVGREGSFTKAGPGVGVRHQREVALTLYLGGMC